MKYLKRISIICILLLFSGGIGNLYSQNKDKNFTPEERAKKISDKMQTELGLNQEQYSKVYQSHLDFFTKVKTLRDNISSDRDNMKSTVKGYRKDLKTQLKGTLSEDQIKKWKEMKKSRKHKGNKDKKEKREKNDVKEKMNN